MRIIGKLRCSIQERAARITWVADLPRYTNKQGVEQRTRIVAMLLNDIVPADPEQAVAFSHEGRYQRIFGFESPVQAGLRHPRFGDHRVHADRTDSLLIPSALDYFS
jgi:hypothetical protein